MSAATTLLQRLREPTRPQPRPIPGTADVDVTDIFLSAAGDVPRVQQAAEAPMTGDEFLR